MERRRSGIVAIIIPIVIGIGGLMTVLSRPRAAQYATVDLLELVAAGMCFGVALVWVLLRLRGNAG